MKRFSLLAGLVVAASLLGAAPAHAACGGNTVCTDPIAGSTASQIAAGLVAGWNGGDFDCSSFVANGFVIFRKIDKVTGRKLEVIVGPVSQFADPVTAQNHHIELGGIYPPGGTIPRVPFDLTFKVCPSAGPACDATAATVLPDGVTTFGEISAKVTTVTGTTSTSSVPALGTAYRIALGLSVLAGALWFVLRRSS